MTQSSVLFWVGRALVPTSKRVITCPSAGGAYTVARYYPPIGTVAADCATLGDATNKHFPDPTIPLAGNPLIKINFHSVVGPLGPATELVVVSLVERPPLFIVAVCFLFLGCEEVIK